MSKFSEYHPMIFDFTVGLASNAEKSIKSIFIPKTGILNLM